LTRQTKFECPGCGKSKHLKGEREADLVRINCGACGHHWVHDPWACPTCGEKMHPARKPLLQKARGTQQSIIGYRIEKVCAGCDPPEDRAPGWMSATLDP